MSQKSKSSSNLNFHAETEVHASTLQSFQEKLRNLKLAASNTLKDLLESSSYRLNAWFIQEKNLKYIRLIILASTVECSKSLASHTPRESP